MVNISLHLIFFTCLFKINYYTCVVDSFVNDMDLKLEQYLDQITDTINVIRARTPKVILEMAMAELKKMVCV